MRSVVLARSGETFPGASVAAPARRIPALAVTSTGRIIVAWDMRPDWRDLPGEIDIAYRYSDDLGATWSPELLLRGHEPGHGFGDASLLVDPQTGRIFCFHVGSTGASFFSAAVAPGQGLEQWLAVSDDDGLSWSFRCLDSLRPADVAGMFAGSGNGTVTASGRLLQPYVLRRHGEHYAGIARSDDHGQTWAMSDLIGPDCDENKVLGLADGRVLLHARATPRRRQAVSGDGVVFSAPAAVEELVDPACNGGLCALGEVLVASMLDDPQERRRLVLHLSCDGAASWEPGLLLDPGACGYSVLAPLPDGTLAVVWEYGDYEGIRFAAISPEELGLTGSAASLMPVEPAGISAAARPPEVAVAQISAESAEAR